MNLGLIHKSLRETLWVTLLCGTAVMVFEAFLAYIFNTFEWDLAEQWLQSDFFQSIIKSLLGTEFNGQIGLGAIGSIAWVHPVLLALLWAHAITICTRVPAGEIDRGTIDVLLSLPVSRWRIYLCETIVWLTGGLLAIAMALLGCKIGHLFISSAEPPEWGRLLMVSANLFLLYSAVGGLALLISSLSDRRGRSVAVVFAVVLVSFFLNFLTQLWEPARSLSFLGVLHYYRPYIILRDGIWPWRDISVLACATVALWTTGGIIFSRRDVCTV